MSRAGSLIPSRPRIPAAVSIGRGSWSEPFARCILRGHPFGDFTLVELLVVIAIIAVLVSLLLPAVSGVKQMGRKAACLSNLRQLGIAVHTYAQDYGGNIPYGPKAPPFTSPASFYPSTGAPTSLLSLQTGAPVGLGLLLKQHLAETPGSFLSGQRLSTGCGGGTREGGSVSGSGQLLLPARWQHATLRPSHEPVAAAPAPAPQRGRGRRDGGRQQQQARERHRDQRRVETLRRRCRTEGRRSRDRVGDGLELQLGERTRGRPGQPDHLRARPQVGRQLEHTGHLALGAVNGPTAASPAPNEPPTTCSPGVKPWPVN